MYEPGSGKCRAKKGLLVLRECGEPAYAVCSGCSTPVCAKHQVVSGQGAIHCPDCAAKDPSMAPRGQAGRSRRRQSYYDHYGYYPYYYGHGGYYHDHHYYSDHDHGSVERSGEAASAAADGAETGEGPGDFDDFDDMES